MSKKITVLVIGCGNMGASHATAYHNHPSFNICGLVSRGKSKDELNDSLKSNYTLFTDYKQAIINTKPDAVCISTYPDTHKEISLFALENNCHIFLEKPIADDLKGSREIINKAVENGKKLVVGYILRHHPIWKKFIIESKKLGKPVAMRMNLNQQSSGETWDVHKNLLASLSPIVDCGVHYLDVMCQITESKPLSVSAIGVRLSDEIPDDNYNYGQLQIRFEDGSVGWYEAGWGPMMSQTAFFVKDVIGPNGSVSIVEPLENTNIKSSKVDSHTKTNMLLIHNQERDDKGAFLNQDQYINTEHEPNHDELCEIEQRYLLKVIEEDLDITQDMVDVINSMKIVLAADKSIRSGKQIKI